MAECSANGAVAFVQYYCFLDQTKLFTFWQNVKLITLNYVFYYVVLLHNYCTGCTELDDDGEIGHGVHLDHISLY